MQAKAMGNHGIGTMNIRNREADTILITDLSLMLNQTVICGREDPYRISRVPFGIFAGNAHGILF